MTIVAVVENVIYTDSYCVTDGLEGRCNKVRISDFGDYCVAGNINTAIQFVNRMEREKDLFCINEAKDPDHTCIVLRLRDTGKIYCVYLGRVGERMAIVSDPDHIGLQYVAGSGSTFFLAFLAEHGNVGKALELTGKYHSDVSGPFSNF